MDDLDSKEINKIVNDIKNKKKISISYLQRTYSFGFVKAHRLFNNMVFQYKKGKTA